MRWIVGFILIAASLLKSFDLYKDPTLVLTGGHAKLLLPMLIGSELSLGFLAVTNISWSRLRVIAILLFTFFAGYTLFLAIQGAASCGCFGRLEVNPWWTFLLDVVVLSGLLLEYYLVNHKEATPHSSSVSLAKTRLALAGTLVLPVALTAHLLWFVNSKENLSEGAFQTVGDLVILEPEKWIGQEFPLSEFIDVNVSNGSWVLLLHRHDCPKCKKVIPKYEQLSRFTAWNQVALIDVPPYDSSQQSRASPCSVGRLSDLRQWFVATPIEIQLEMGVVVNVSTDLPALSDLKRFNQNKTRPISRWNRGCLYKSEGNSVLNYPDAKYSVGGMRCFL
jgi:hypothetical protein